jgi:beta-carotene hydroxylase
VNRAGDATITWRHTNRNTWWIAISYFFVSAYYQSGPIKEYIRKAKANNPKLYRTVITQYSVWISSLVLSFVIGVTMHGWKTGLLLWALAVAGPGFFGMWSMMWFNYMQHVHTDPWSKHNHSRNITGRVFNFLVFNNGLHTAHHENPGAHWSTLPALHAKIAHDIDPRLNEWSFWWWVIRGYVIPAFNKNWETKQIGRAPFDVPSKDLSTDSVDALDAGNNAQMA